MPDSLEWESVFGALDVRRKPQSNIYLRWGDNGLGYRIFEYFPHLHYERSDEEYSFDQDPSLDQILDSCRDDENQPLSDGGMSEAERLVEEYVEMKRFVDQKKPYWLNLTGGTTYSGELRFELENFFPEAHYKKAIGKAVEGQSVLQDGGLYSDTEPIDSQSGAKADSEVGVTWDAPSTDEFGRSFEEQLQDNFVHRFSIRRDRFLQGEYNSDISHLDGETEMHGLQIIYRDGGPQYSIETYLPIWHHDRAVNLLEGRKQTQKSRTREL